MERWHFRSQPVHDNCVRSNLFNIKLVIVALGLCGVGVGVGVMEDAEK